MSTGHVTYVAWAKSTSLDSETELETELPGLRLDDKTGLLMKAAPPDGPDADTSTDYFLSLALRRRALASDIADACVFEAMDTWHETMLAALLQEPPPGYTRVSYKQLELADTKVWKMTNTACRSDCKRKQERRRQPSSWPSWLPPQAQPSPSSCSPCRAGIATKHLLPVLPAGLPLQTSSASTGRPSTSNGSRPPSPTASARPPTSPASASAEAAEAAALETGVDADVEEVMMS